MLGILHCPASLLFLRMFPTKKRPELSTFRAADLTLVKYCMALHYQITNKRQPGFALWAGTRFPVEVQLIPWKCQRDPTCAMAVLSDLLSVLVWILSLPSSSSCE